MTKNFSTETSPVFKQLMATLANLLLLTSLINTCLASANDKYIIDDNITINTKDGATVTAILVRPKNASAPLATALQFNIYVDEKRNLQSAMQAAEFGYAGIVAFPRGKRSSPDKIVPYEYETIDTHAVLDWIVQQPWSDGQVGMYGGSYLGFAAWAATKKPHPALKTIVPYVAAIPGLGLPMENNISLNANYGWGFYVTNNKTLDNDVYKDRGRWQSLNEKWFKSGLAYRQYDTVDGTPNPLFQKWLRHPDYDSYWQKMVPFRQDFAHIDIPVLSITGYFDDGQISALHYLDEHEKCHHAPEHYLVIGPYDHWTAQTTSEDSLRGYTLDDVAKINVPELTFAWFDYIFKGAQKPALLKDKINYQLMTDNSWQSAPSFQSLHQNPMRLYLSNNKTPNGFSLSSEQNQKPDSLSQTVDLADRNISHNTGYYPWPIIQDQTTPETGISYLSEPLTQDIIMAGRFSATLKVQINKKDMDVGLTLYEVLPNGQRFHLAYLLGRASYAKDMTQRQLLTPGEIETIHFKRSRMTGKRLSKGSRLLLHLDINKNHFAQVNYGTGKAVSMESIADAKEPLEIQWFTDSFIDVPMKPYQQD